ncbi:MAG: methyltransferase, partial [Paraburkholderia nemoris]
MTSPATLTWPEADGPRSARWRSEAAVPPPKRVIVADDRTTADSAYRLACEGTALLWNGDFQNARQLLQAVTRRLERKPRKQGETPLDAFNLHRQAQSQRARTLGMILIPLDAAYAIPLRRAPDVQQACIETYGPSTDEPSVVSLRELLGMIGAHEWRKKGVEIPA